MISHPKEDDRCEPLGLRRAPSLTLRNLPSRNGAHDEKCAVETGLITHYHSSLINETTYTLSGRRIYKVEPSL